MAPNDIIMEHFQNGQIPDFKKKSILDIKPEIFKCTLITIIEMIFRFNFQNKFLYFTLCFSRASPEVHSRLQITGRGNSGDRAYDMLDI